MGLEYFDLFLMHWPVTFQVRSDHIASARTFPGSTYDDKAIVTVPDGKPAIDWAHTAETIAAASGQKGSLKPAWRALQQVVSKEKARAVGVSNFNVDQLREVLSVGGEVPVSCNQVEAHPWFPNTELFTFMRDQGILGSAYCPFAGQLSQGARLIEEPVVQAIAAKNSMGVGQLLQSWAVQRGTIPLGKSQNPGEQSGLGPVSLKLMCQKQSEFRRTSMCESCRRKTLRRSMAWTKERMVALLIWVRFGALNFSRH